MNLIWLQKPQFLNETKIYRNCQLIFRQLIFRQLTGRENWVWLQHLLVSTRRSMFGSSLDSRSTDSSDQYSISIYNIPAGWPHWANFRHFDHVCIWYLYIKFDKRWVGLHFGRMCDNSTHIYLWSPYVP
jgi:hypothetical protein